MLQIRQPVHTCGSRACSQAAGRAQVPSRRSHVARKRFNRSWVVDERGEESCSNSLHRPTSVTKMGATMSVSENASTNNELDDQEADEGQGTSVMATVLTAMGSAVVYIIKKLRRWVKLQRCSDTSCSITTIEYVGEGGGCWQVIIMLHDLDFPAATCWSDPPPVHSIQDPFQHPLPCS